MYKILSIDGGGLRGIVPVQILKHIETITNKNIIDCFDLFAGTSTGGLITSGLTVKSKDGFSPKHSVDDIEQVYLKEGKNIFPIKNELHQWYRNKVWSYLRKPQFKADGLHAILENLLLDENKNPLKISDCLKPIFIPTYDLVTNSPLLFKGRYAFHNSDYDANLIDVCRATSAGPTYLPTYSFNYKHKFGKLKTSKVATIDGGVYMNNPSMGALVEILKHREDDFYNYPHLKNEDIFLLSIGTGDYTNDISHQSANWGKLEWIKPTIDIMMLGNNQAVDYQMKEALSFSTTGRINYLRINVNIEEEKFADMANSDTQTLEYLQERVKKDYLNNATLQNELSKFIHDAGL